MIKRCLLLCAGRGTRFIETGYKDPKPLIKIFNKTMLEWVYSTLPECEEYIFAFLKEHIEQYNLESFVQKLTGNRAKVVSIDKVTRGAAETALLSLQQYADDGDILIVNSDQYIEYQKLNFNVLSKTDVFGIIFTFHANHPKWSFAEYNQSKGLIVRVAEKDPISDLATTGNYYYKNTNILINGIRAMIDKNIRTNGEFYLCPVYNELIGMGHKVVPFMVDFMLGMGTPEDLEVFKRDVYKSR